MINDIVTRLQDIGSLRGNMSGSVIPVACMEAADEIERLRAENKFLRQFADDLETASEIDRVRFTSKIISLEMELRHER